MVLKNMAIKKHHLQLYMMFIDFRIKSNHLQLVGGWPTPLKNMSSSVGMMTFLKLHKIPWFQTTNQIFIAKYPIVSIWNMFLIHNSQESKCSKPPTRQIVDVFNDPFLVDRLDVLQNRHFLLAESHGEPVGPLGLTIWKIHGGLSRSHKSGYHRYIPSGQLTWLLKITTLNR